MNGLQPTNTTTVGSTSTADNSSSQSNVEHRTSSAFVLDPELTKIAMELRAFINSSPPSSPSLGNRTITKSPTSVNSSGDSGVSETDQQTQETPKETDEKTTEVDGNEAINIDTTSTVESQEGGGEGGGGDPSQKSESNNTGLFGSIINTVLTATNTVAASYAAKAEARLEVSFSINEIEKVLKSHPFTESSFHYSDDNITFSAFKIGLDLNDLIDKYTAENEIVEDFIRTFKDFQLKLNSKFSSIKQDLDKVLGLMFWHPDGSAELHDAFANYLDRITPTLVEFIEITKHRTLYQKGLVDPKFINASSNKQDLDLDQKTEAHDIRKQYDELKATLEHIQYKIERKLT
ncbi:MAG: hypothetical protein S4CHLAM20_01740 [Chlamydiia bacterium]|nr:hypothetical protein [Chlamydiia bacterium]